MMAEVVQSELQQQLQQQPPANSDGAAATPAAATADSQTPPQNGRKPKQPIKYVAPPKAKPGNPNFVPRKAWPGGSIVVKLPDYAPPPGTHRWKQSSANENPKQPQPAGRGSKLYAPSAFSAGPAPQNGRGAAAARGTPAVGSRLRGGSVNMHSAVALELQSTPGGNGGSVNGHFGGDAPEPGEVPAGPRRRVPSYSEGATANAAAAARPASGLAQLYKQAQEGSGSLLEAMAQRRGSGGSPHSGGGGGPHGSGGGWGHSLRRPSGGSPGFSEGYEEAEKVVAAAAKGQWRLANSRAAVVAALPPGDEGEAARRGFRSRIKRQQQKFAHDDAYVAELEEYLQTALGGGGSGGSIGRPAAAAADSFSFGSTVSVAVPEAWADGGRRRNVGVLRHGSREVQVVGGGVSREVSPAAGVGAAAGGGNGRTVSNFKGYKRKAAWQAGGDGGSGGPVHRRVVAINSGGGGSNPKFAIPKFAKPAAGKPAAAQPAAQQPPKKLAASPPPPSIGQKLGMSLDAIAGKCGQLSAADKARLASGPAGNKSSAAGKAAAAGSGAAAGGAAAGGSGSEKHSLAGLRNQALQCKADRQD